MAELQHSQIRSKLLESVAPHVDAQDIQTKSPEQRELHILSRSVGVTALVIVVDADLRAAAQATVDGGLDNGIDLIYYDQQARILCLVQSKWNSNHSSSISSGDVLKFLQGVQDLVSLKKERFNAKIQAKWSAIEDALNRLSSVRLVIAYSGSTQIASDTQAKLDEFIRSQNDTSELFFLQTVSQKELFQHFLREAAPPEINLTIKLAHYGHVESPWRAVYGQLSASDVVEWYNKYGNQLFDGNIRHFLGMKSDVNSAISKTIIDEPDKFWYFNNGLTLIVQSLQKQAFGGNDRSVGLFDCKNVTIVNGAQTVGTIGRVQSSATMATLQARIIVVEDPDSLIGKEITRASNTQNKIDSRNFVALDPEQERIRTELLIEGVEYEYREGEVIGKPAEAFEFIEAVTVLACASAEVSYVAMAKGYVGGLYADINSPPYRAMFNAGTSSKRLWKSILLSRRIDHFIREVHDVDSAVERGIVVHGNRLLSHLIFRALKASQEVLSDDLGESDAGHRDVYSRSTKAGHRVGIQRRLSSALVQKCGEMH